MKTKNTERMNRTGADTAPDLSKEMLEGAESLTKFPPGSAQGFHDNRARYMAESDPVGSMPPSPSTATLLLDKLGERLAFERAGTRIYDALISKHESSPSSSTFPSIDRLREFRDEEHEHFLMMAQAIRELGGDPTVMTPAADVNGVAAMGWMQVMTDPRTTFAQSLEMILMAELVDNDGWETLIHLAHSAGQSELADRFRVAYEQEKVHLEHVRKWVRDLGMLELRSQGGLSKDEVA